jgi:hypothetical protein
MLVDGLSGFDFNASAQHGTVFNREAFRLQVSGDIPGAPKLDLLAAYDFSVHATPHNHFARKNVRFHFAVGSDGQDAVTQIHFSFHLAVDEKIFAAGNFAFDANSLADGG